MSRLRTLLGRKQTATKSDRVLFVEELERRQLLSSVPANVLVNDPAEDQRLKFPDNVQSETSVVLAGGNVVVAYNDLALNGQFTSFSVSTDGGATFTDKGALPDLPTDSTGSDGGDPVLAYDATAHTLYLATLSAFGAGIQVFTSSDDGQAFSPPVNAAPGNLQDDFLDKSWITVDNYPGSGNGNVYLTYTQFAFGYAPHGIYLTRSTDGGASWGPAGGLLISSEGAYVQGSQVVVGPDHTVYVFWVDENSYSGDILMMSKSTDQGLTFSAPITVQQLHNYGYLGLSSINGYFNTNSFPAVAVNPVNGDLYVAYDDVGAGADDLADVLLTQSIDGGATWTSPVRLNNDGTANDQWQPSLAVTPDGTKLGVFWYDRRFDVHNDLIDRVGVIGSISDHSLTFGQNFRITDTSFPAMPTYYGYMGDYDTATADNSYFYTTWGDNRDGLDQGPNVRLAKIPVAGLPPQTPLAHNDLYFTPPGAVLKPNAAHGVLANDIDVENDTITAILQSSPQHGSLLFNADGSFTYKPVKRFKGTDSFTYIAQDQDGSSDLITVTIKVQGKALVARNNQYRVRTHDFMFVPPSRGLLANDTFPRSLPVTVEVTNAPMHGEVLVDADGSFVYRPDKGFKGLDRFTYVFFSGESMSNEATVAFVVP